MPPGTNVGALLEVPSECLQERAKSLAEVDFDMSAKLAYMQEAYPHVADVLAVAEQDMLLGRLAQTDARAFEDVLCAYRFGFVASFALLEPELKKEPPLQHDSIDIYGAEPVNRTLLEAVFSAVVYLRPVNPRLDLQETRQRVAILAGTYEMAQYVHAEH